MKLFTKYFSVHNFIPFMYLLKSITDFIKTSVNEGKISKRFHDSILGLLIYEINYNCNNNIMTK